MTESYTSPLPAPDLDDLAPLVAEAVEKTSLLGRLEMLRPCPRCQHELSGIPVTARYCPRCGIEFALLAEQPAPFATVVRGSDDGTSHTLLSQTLEQLERFRPLAALAGEMPATGARRRSILLGYASALYHLGWRYERANGAGRNLDEALRCYGKAARLTQSDALPTCPKNA